MKTMISLFLIVLAVNTSFGEGYKIGDQAADFKLKNVDGKYISLGDFSNAKGFVVVFTCNNCPYARAYQDRILALDKEFKTKGFPVIAINPNDPAIEPADSYDAMVARAKDKGYTFPYLFDEKHEIFRLYGATNTPHAFVLKKDAQGKLIVKYIGALDDNYQDASAVKKPYLENAVNALLSGKDPEPSSTKAIGCGVKSKPI
jgi:peroxiredoxin